MSFLDDLRKKLHGAVAQANPFDSGQTYSTVTNNRVPTPAPAPAALSKPVPTPAPGHASFLHDVLHNPVTHAFGTAGSDIVKLADSSYNPTTVVNKAVVTPLVNQAAAGVRSVYDIGRGAAASLTNNPVALANAHKAKATDEPQFLAPVTRPVAQAAETVLHPFSTHTVTPTTESDKRIFGSAPIQNVQAGVASNYAEHPNLPTPARAALAGAYGLGQAAQDILTLLGGKKVAADTVDAAKPAIRSAAGTAREVAANPVPLGETGAVKLPGGSATPEPIDQKQFAADYLKNNPEQALKDYQARTMQEFGTSVPNVVSADESKFIIPNFGPDKSAAYHEAASAYAKDYYKKLLADESTKDKPVLITAGGAGAGKSSGLQLASKETPGGLDRYAAINDTNLANMASADSRIQPALDSGRKVRILYTYRDPTEAFVNGNIPRAARTGRVVPIEPHADTHIGSLQTIQQLAEKYKDNPNVSIKIVDNSRGKGNETFAPVDFLKNKQYNKDELIATLRKELDNAKNRNQVSQEAYQTYLGLDSGTPRLGQVGSGGTQEGAANAQAKGVQETLGQDGKSLRQRSEQPRLATPNDTKAATAAELGIPKGIPYAVNKDGVPVLDMSGGKTIAQHAQEILRTIGSPAAQRMSDEELASLVSTAPADSAGSPARALSQSPGETGSGRTATPNRTEVSQNTAPQSETIGGAQHSSTLSPQTRTQTEISAPTSQSLELRQTAAKPDAVQPHSSAASIAETLGVSQGKTTALDRYAAEARGIASMTPLSEQIKARAMQVSRLGEMTPVEKSLYQQAKAQETEMARKVKAAGNSAFGGDIPTGVDAAQYDVDPTNISKKVNILDFFRTPERVLRKIGLAPDADAIRAADMAYKEELPQQINRISQWYDEVGRSNAASQRIFKYLDGQRGAKKALQGNELRVANEMKQYLSDWADRLKLPEENRISNYITHIFESGFIEKEFDPDLAKLIDDRVPGSVYDPFTQHRLGKRGYKEDAFAALDAYAKRATRKVNFDPALERLSENAQLLDVDSLKYVKQYADRINMRPTFVDNLIDNAIKQTPIGYKLGQRPLTRASGMLRQATYRASLGLNFGSAVRNLTQGINTYAELGNHYTSIGYIKAIQAIAQHSDELKRAGVLDNSFIEDRSMSATKKAMQRFDDGLMTFFTAAEHINRGAAYFGAKAKALAEGKSLEEAEQYGTDMARKTQFAFGRIDTPVWLNNDLAKTLGQFQNYSVKQGEFLFDMAKNKEFRKMLRFTGASIVVYATIGRALGYKPTDMLPSVQIGGTKPFKTPGDIGSAIVKSFTAKDTTSSTRGTQIRKAWQKVGGDVGYSTVPGFAQGKKTVEGIKAVLNGKYQPYGGSAETIAPTPMNFAKGALFGPTVLQGPKANTSTSGASASVTGGNAGVAAAEASNPLQDKAALAEAFGKDFAALKSDTDRKAWAQQSPQNNAIYQEYLSAKKGLSNPNLPYGLDTQSADFLHNYNRLTPGAQQKKLYGQNDYEYRLNQAQYAEAKAKGNMSTTDEINWQGKLDRAQVGADYNKDTRDLYGLSKTKLYDFLQSAPDSAAKTQMMDDLISYDKALHDNGITTSLKFKYGFDPNAASGARKSSSKLKADLKALSSPTAGVSDVAKLGKLIGTTMKTPNSHGRIAAGKPHLKSMVVARKSGGYGNSARTTAALKRLLTA